MMAEEARPPHLTVLPLPAVTAGFESAGVARFVYAVCPMLQTA